jgi:hypothetical protein
MTDKLVLREPAIAVPSLADVRAAIRVLFEPGQIVELRGLGVKNQKKFILSGYYDDHELLAQDAIKVCETPGIFGTYFTLQKLKPELLLRSPNKYHVAKAGDCTADEDVLAYRFLPIDLDPRRAAGISSTDEEKMCAHAVMTSVTEFFKSLGVETIQADSSNGYHCLARIDLPASDKSLVQRVIAAVADRFATDAVDVDLSIHNASRIWKVYGSVSRKGHSSVERPHRAARLLSIPETPLEPVSRELLEKIAEEIPAEPDKKEGKKATAHELDWAKGKLEEFMFEAHIEHGSPSEYKSGFKWILKRCVFNPEHTKGCAIVTMAESSALGYRCLHNSCFGKTWSDFRKYGEGVIGHEFEFKEKAAPLDPKSIITNPGHLSEMIRRSEEVLHGMGLKYFERGGLLVNTAYGREVTTEKEIDRAKDSVIIQASSNESMVRDLDALATFVKRKEIMGMVIDEEVHVPNNLPAQLHDRVRSQVRETPYPTLDVVTSSPVLLPSGSMHSEGEAFQEGVMFVGGLDRDIRFPPVTGYVSRQDALAALKEFEDIFNGFPFVDPEYPGRKWNETASYSVALCGPLALVARPYLGLGAIPIIGARAPMRRSGKTKIIEAGSMAALGHKPTTVHYTNEEELGKHLLPLMTMGDRAVLIDNIERPLQSSKLCILVTNGQMWDRILGESTNVLLKNYSVIFATGNNLTFGGDLTARALRCDIDPKHERPEARAFAFDPVRRAQERHPALVRAALTMLRGYLMAKSPWLPEREPWGGFERFDQLISGCLVWLGCADPYEARERIISDDPVRSGNVDILEAWYLRYNERTVSFADIQKNKGDVFDALLKDGFWNGYHARWVLSRLEGQVIGGYRLVRGAGRSKFRVLKAGEQTSFEDAASAG